MEAPPGKRKAMTGAERVRAHRKRKAESDPQHKEKENERIANHLKRQKAVMNEEELEQHRKSTAERVRLCRLRKKIKKVEQVEVSVMNPGRKGTWYWPGKADVFTYNPEDVLAKLSTPIPVGMVGVDDGESVLYEFR